MSVNYCCICFITLAQGVIRNFKNAKSLNFNFRHFCNFEVQCRQKVKIFHFLFVLSAQKKDLVVILIRIQI